MRGRTRSAAAGSTLLAALVMSLGFLFAFADPAAARPAQVSIAIFDDDADRAMFPGLNLAPDHTYTQCLRIQAQALEPQDSVRLAAVDVAGTLAAHLQLTVELGDGARYGDCAGFTGAVLFQGSLADLAASGTRGVATGWTPDADPARSFRVTVALDASTPQGVTAEGSFVWQLTSNASPEVTPTTPTPTPTPTTTPTTATPAAPTTPTTTSTTDPTDPTPSVTPESSPSPTTRPTVPGGGSSSGGGSRIEPDLTLGRALARVQEVSRQVAVTVGAVVSRPQYPLLALLFALAFLIVQDRIDRRDPKLAVSSVRQRDNEVFFPDRFGGAL